MENTVKENQGTVLIYNSETKKNEAWTEAEIEKDRLFREALGAQPSPWITYGIITINVAVFILMVLNAVSFFAPTAADLVRWGADFGPLTTHGQWWRILTAAFVHIGVIHLLMNMYILLCIGQVTERLFGKAGFITLYLLAGVGGNLASLAFHPFTVAAGASGAVFGLYGGLLGYLLLQRAVVPQRRVAALAKGAGIFLVYNMVYGVSQSNVDIAAHIGGFVSGFLLGCVLARPLLPAARNSGLRRSLAVLLTGVAVAGAGASRVPAVDDWKAEIQGLSKVEQKTLALFNDSVKKLNAHEIKAAEFNQIIEKQVLPPWKAERERLSRLKVADDQRSTSAQLVEYMSLRAEGWSLLEKGLQTDDEASIKQAQEKQASAERIVLALNGEKH